MRRRTFMLGSAVLAAAPAARAGEAPVVLELFTSQGCSSCPPADALLGELARRSNVIALAWHVDYWNGLGWHDPYATRRATDRQRAYAAQLHTEVYTPALVVNGAAVVVGSDRAAVAQAIGRVPKLSVPVALHAEQDRLSATLGATAEPVTALLATYDPQRDTAIGAGENDGRRLREYHIVRTIAMPGLDTAAARALAFPRPAPGQGAALLVQARNLRIVGAADWPGANTDRSLL